MNQIKKILKNKLILGIIIGISITSTIVYAAYIEATEIRFTSSTGLKSSNVQDAIEEISKKCSSNNSNDNNDNNNNNNDNNDNSGSNEPAKTYKCKRASTLHTETCQSESNSGCQGSGMSSGDAITYGNLGTKGTLKAGDAFDCDVNGDGTYDSATERFYYISNYYDTQSKTFNNDYAVLLYYKSVSKETSEATYAYNQSGQNWYGPSDQLKTQLPVWNNISLYKSTRSILNENGGNTTSGGTLPSDYSYSGKSARFLTYQELKAGCPNASTREGSLSSCLYLLENTSFSKQGGKGYWLETPQSSSSNSAFDVDGSDLYIDFPTSSISTSDTVRPAIEVLKTNIDY